MRVAVVSVLLFLSGCAFSAERALFTGADAAYPFAEGARAHMRTSGGDDDIVVFHRAPDGGYFLTGEGENAEERMPILFVEVPETPEEDYIVQVVTNHESFGFGFAWRTPEGLRILSNPNAFNGTLYAAQLDTLCTRLSHGECQLTSPDGVRAVAAQVIAAFVRSGETPEDWIDLVPVG